MLLYSVEDFVSRIQASNVLRFPKITFIVKNDFFYTIHGVNFRAAKIAAVREKLF